MFKSGIRQNDIKIFEIYLYNSVLYILFCIICFEILYFHLDNTQYLKKCYFVRILHFICITIPLFSTLHISFEIHIIQTKYTHPG